MPRHALILLLSVVALCSAADAAQSRRAKLTELQALCKDGLLTETECAEERRKILAETQEDAAAPGWYCNYGGEDVDPASVELSGALSFSEQASASKIVKEILDAVGLAPNFVVQGANVPNAAASARQGQRYVEYNPEFITQLKSGTGTNWGVYSVMAHEIGHHLQGHTLQNGGSRPDIELEADEYSGYVMKKLGASLAQAQAAMQKLGSDTSSGTHPAKNSRLAAIRKGWEKTAGNAADPTETVEPPVHDPDPLPNPPPITPPPVVTPAYSDLCVISGETVVIGQNGAIYSRNRGMQMVGQKLPPAHPTCMFDLQAPQGRYCVAHNGAVHYGSPIPVGQCQPCSVANCN